MYLCVAALQAVLQFLGWCKSIAKVNQRRLDLSVCTNLRLVGKYVVGSGDFHVNVGSAGKTGSIANSSALQYTLGYNREST